MTRTLFLLYLLMASGLALWAQEAENDTVLDEQMTYKLKLQVYS